MPHVNLIALAVPFFFLLIGLEWAIARRMGRRVYRTADALADLGCGVGQQVAVVFFGAALGGLYVGVYRRFAIAHLHGAAAWAIALVAVDFIYYWWHRASHRVNVLWAAHAVHHQSEDYNLAVALRQGILTPLTAAPFYLPLAVLGVPPLVLGAASSINTLYQFWIHTELVGKLPRPLEAVLNTPSHHRVHHAVNAEYLDKNYAGMFIVFDRLFGTFTAERARCTYGTVKRLFSFNAVYAQFAELHAVARKARGRSWLHPLQIWFRPPEWSPDGPAPIPDPPATKFATPARPALQGYAAVQFAALVAPAFALMLFDALPGQALALPGALVFWGLLTLGGLMDGRRWALPLEWVRVAVSGAALAAWAAPRYGLPVAAVAAGLALGSLGWLRGAGRAPDGPPALPSAGA